MPVMRTLAANVALLLSGLVLTTPAQSVWTARSSGTTNYLNSVTWTGSQFVAVGGSILTSPDGINWTSRSSPVCCLNAVTWAGSQLVAVGGTISGADPDPNPYTSYVLT